ncbi:type II toxin-antitoxin system RelE/ParE family toxin [Catellatospora citrea]|uniref:type II toxin-antitoxin system RelE/ParE family toxin n=1 Tax=Catellatospora citrea TaxID=53366 RepID=UPI0023B2FB68|nr:type II toxin-antitoxin system RelE/ParE family toxin [Catellatospora citrea]
MARGTANDAVRESGVLHRLLGDQGPLLDEPYTRQLDGKLRELRFHLEGQQIRVTYWIAADRRIILLTVFRKTRWRESREISRARRALTACVAEAHTVEDEEVAR